MNKFVSSREIHETWVGFIHNSVYSSCLRLLYTGQTHKKWTSSSIQLHNSLFRWDGTWFVVPSQFNLKPVTTHPQFGESCAVLCHLNLGEVTLQFESGLEQSVSS